MLPVREMKIDRSFVAGMSSDVRDAAIVRHSIDLGRSLGLRVVAEGVESAEDHAILAGMGCDHAQGFYYSRPVPAAVFEAWVVEAEERRSRRGPHDRAGRRGRLSRERRSPWKEGPPPASLPPLGASMRSSESHLQAMSRHLAGVREDSQSPGARAREYSAHRLRRWS